jgi:hypothetical protein
LLLGRKVINLKFMVWKNLCELLQCYQNYKTTYALLKRMFILLYLRAILSFPLKKGCYA